MTNGFTQSTNILGLAIDPANPQTLYASTTVTPGVYKTQDGGAHWAKGPWPFPMAFAEGLLVDPTLHSRVWVSTLNGVLVSLDSGSTWAGTPTPLPHLSLARFTQEFTLPSAIKATSVNAP